MLLLAYILLAVAVAYALHQRARRKAAEWDRDDADRAAQQDRKAADDEIARVRTERDKAEEAIEGCRLAASEARDERDKLARDLADARHELQVLRGHQEQCSRAHGDAQRNASIGRIEALARVKKIAELAREAGEVLE